MEWTKETINAALTFDLCLALADDSQTFVVRSYILQVIHQRLEELEQKAVTGNIPSYDELRKIYEAARKEYVEKRKNIFDFEYKAQCAGIRGIFEHLRKLNDKCKSCDCKHE